MRNLDWVKVALVTLLVLLVAAVVFIFVRDQRADARCHRIGGQTWDDGEHCVIGDYRVVNTR